MRPLRIVTTGLAVTYPFGGVFWDYLQYSMGLARLGHDVLYLEDPGYWCYDPHAGTFVEDASRNLAAFTRHLEAAAPELTRRWSYRDPSDSTHGRSWGDVVRFCREADLFLHISASCWMRDEYRKAARVAFVDSDPLYTQAFLLDCPTAKEVAERRQWWRDYHDVLFSFGENIGKAGCRVPTAALEWLPTRQPVVLDAFADFAVPPEARRPVLTTVASWEPTEKGPVVEGVAYGGKSREFERFVDLPRHSPLPIEVALSGPAPKEHLREHGWLLREALDVSADPFQYRDYLAHSTAECSVAKNAYVATRSGWFSCRTACYLALGVPAVVQDTGFRDYLPTGEGLFAFSALEEAADAIARIVREPARHGRAARALAAEHFDSRAVLTHLLERALA